MNFVRRLSVCAQSPYYLLLHSVPERSRRHILNSHLGAWACRRHIISIVLKSVCFLEHLWCSFGNSKTLLFQQIFVDFVLLKQTQKLYPQWLRQAQPPILLLHGAWACRRHILNSHLAAWACRRHHYFYFIKIRALLRTSLMFLWELKNGIISTKSPWTLCY